MRFPFGLSPKRPTEGPQYADLYSRAMAVGLDLMLMFVLLNSLFYYKASLIGAMECKQAPEVKTWAELAILMSQKFFSGICFLDNAIEVLMIGILIVASQLCFGNTPGKWLLGLKIVRVGTLEPIEPWRYILRFFAYIPSLLPFGLGVLWISFNKQRRAWHDYIAGTVVLNTHTYEWYKKQLKRGFNKLRGRSSTAVEQPVSEPPAE